MESTIESLSAAYQDFISAATAVLESRQSSDGEETPATATALEAFKQRWELLRVACDQAEELVESVRQRIGSECLVDEATGAGAGSASGPGSQGIPPISAVRLEQMSKAVRWLVIELQHGSGGAAGGGVGLGGGAHPHGPVPTGFDARFTEDGAQ
ncbi:mediator of RNA polymerase II transcription subunit 32-like protein [Carex littledalei]|uniref:Mediator of RNA polymerase II transcription subunit 32-like protein n=1 Tax=Carex littledalei TaxID=544730 RepID=A0A833QDU6_9POAL|nr:mediator of RNA polymerase II transcription subunit 32-like protein [Carex littledalei]